MIENESKNRLGTLGSQKVTFIRKVLIDAAVITADGVEADQWERDQEATQLVMNQELEQDKQDYLNDPLLWDADSDKRLQTLESG